MDAETTYTAVSDALEEGYRHVDTAQEYENESSVGRAIADANVDRDEIFLTTKVHVSNRSIKSIVTSVEESLKKLDVEYVDLLLIHMLHPLADLETVMAGLNEAINRGMARHLGVSNFGKERLDRARSLSDAPVLTDQVLFHPWWPQRDLLQYCQQENVMLTAYSPLANGGVLGDELLESIGKHYGKTGPQVAIRWATQHKNVAAIPMSTSREHLAENLDIFDFKLTREEHDRITRPSYRKTVPNQMRALLGSLAVYGLDPVKRLLS